MYKLLIKTHNQTGLKYLCYTRQEDHETYPGSGTYWKRHIKKHGRNISTEIIFETVSKEEFKKVALQKSKEYNVVSSKEWANFRPEQGDGGLTTTSFKKGNIPWIQGKKVPSIGEKKKLYWEEWHREHPNNREGWKRNQRKGFSNEVRETRRQSIISLNKILYICPHCGKSGHGPNMKRWHFDSCGKKIEYNSRDIRTGRFIKNGKNTDT